MTALGASRLAARPGRRRSPLGLVLAGLVASRPRASLPEHHLARATRSPARSARALDPTGHDQHRHPRDARAAHAARRPGRRRAGPAGRDPAGRDAQPAGRPGIMGINAGAAVVVVLAIIALRGRRRSASTSGSPSPARASRPCWSTRSPRSGREGATPVKLALAGAAVTAGFSSRHLGDRDDQRGRAQRAAVLAGRVARRPVPAGPDPARAVPDRRPRRRAAVGRALNGLALGEDVARALGSGWSRRAPSPFVIVAVLCGAATAACGPIVFVGLVVPHVARMLCGPDYRWILPYSLRARAADPAGLRHRRPRRGVARASCRSASSSGCSARRCSSRWSATDGWCRCEHLRDLPARASRRRALRLGGARASAVVVGFVVTLARREHVRRAARRACARCSSPAPTPASTSSCAACGCRGRPRPCSSVSPSASPGPSSSACSATRSRRRTSSASCRAPRWRPSRVVVWNLDGPRAVRCGPGRRPASPRSSSTSSPGATGSAATGSSSWASASRPS